MSSNNARPILGPEMPTGTEVAAFKKYAEATRAVDRLAEGGFPLDSVTIVGSDLHVVERIVGKLTPARIALGGAGQGLTWGLLMGLFALLLMPEAGGLLAIIAIAFGVLMGVLLAAITWGVSRKKRSFASRNAVVAAHYTILVSQEPQRAFNILANVEGNISQAVRRPARLEEAERTRARRERTMAEPPAFGVRLTDVQASVGKGENPSEIIETSTVEAESVEELRESPEPSGRSGPSESSGTSQSPDRT